MRMKSVAIVRRTPLHSEHHALLRKPQWTQPNNDELDQMHDNAIQYRGKFRKSGVKKNEGESSYEEVPDLLASIQAPQQFPRKRTKASGKRGA
jgi:hypothetical protein